MSAPTTAPIPAAPPRVKPGPVATFFGPTNYVAEFADMALEPADSDPTTFGELANGETSWEFSGKSQTSTATNAFHSFQRKNVGKEVAIVFAPHGNVTATADQPHVKFTVRISTPPPLAQAVGEDKGQFYDWKFPVIGQPSYAETGKLPGM